MTKRTTEWRDTHRKAVRLVSPENRRNRLYRLMQMFTVHTHVRAWNVYHSSVRLNAEDGVPFTVLPGGKGPFMSTIPLMPDLKIWAHTSTGELKLSTAGQLSIATAENTFRSLSPSPCAQHCCASSQATFIAITFSSEHAQYISKVTPALPIQSSANFSSP